MKPTVLCILDGFGIAPPSKANAVSLAKMPVFNNLWKKYSIFRIFAALRVISCDCYPLTPKGIKKVMAR